MIDVLSSSSGEDPPAPAPPQPPPCSTLPRGSRRTGKQRGGAPERQEDTEAGQRRQRPAQQCTRGRPSPPQQPMTSHRHPGEQGSERAADAADGAGALTRSGTRSQNRSRSQGRRAAGAAGSSRRRHLPRRPRNGGRAAVGNRTPPEGCHAKGRRTARRAREPARAGVPGYAAGRCQGSGSASSAPIGSHTAGRQTKPSSSSPRTSPAGSRARQEARAWCWKAPGRKRNGRCG